MTIMLKKRNLFPLVANIVPKYRLKDEFLATTAAIEYAIHTLGIKNIIVCGHSNCGGCEALYQSDDKLANTPIVKKWLMIIENIKTEVLKYKDSDPIFLSYVFGLVEKALLMFKDLGEFDSMGIQEVECGDSDYYYILIYLLK